jgi:hypothetical protein
MKRTYFLATKIKELYVSRGNSVVPTYETLSNFRVCCCFLAASTFCFIILRDMRQWQRSLWLLKTMYVST